MSDAPSFMRPEDLEKLWSLIEEVASACQSALHESVSDSTATREVARRLGLSTTNAWRVVRLAHDGPTVRALQSMPGPKGWETILSALARANATAFTVAALQAAVARLQEELGRQGLSRSDLPRLSEAGGEARRQEIEAIDRHQEMRANALLWGASARAMATSYMVRVDARTGRPLLIGVSTFAGLQRTRPGPQWWLPSPSLVQFAGRSPVTLAPDPRTSLDLAPLLTDHARVELGRSPEGHIAFLGEHAEGRGPVDLAVSAGGIVEADHQGSLLERLVIFSSPIWIPTGKLVLEVLFERSAAPPRAPQISTYAQIGSRPVADVDRDLYLMPSAGRLFPETSVQCEDLQPPFKEASRSGRDLHAAALELAIASMGLQPGDFVRYRLFVAHPVLCTSVELDWTPDRL